MEQEYSEGEGPAPTEDGPAPITPARGLRRNSSMDLTSRQGGGIGFTSPRSTRRRRGSVMSEGKSQSVKGPMGSSADASPWVPDDMALSCCVCKADFTVYRRRHHCRTCGRVACDDCTSKRIRGDRTCLQCWDRIGRKMSGLSLPSNDDDAATAAAAATATGGVRKSALFVLLEEERFNRKVILADGRTVSYSVAGVTDGLPVFLFLGLDSHRHSAAHFEDLARRRGLQLICIDRPGRGCSDPVPRPEVDAEAGAEVDSQALVTEAIEAAVVDTVKQLCVKLRIGKAAMLGQSMGAVFAMRCARSEELKDIFEGTTVHLVSPWVPLAARGCNAFLHKASSMAVFTSTVGRLGGELMVKQVGDMARGSGGASDVEKGYLEAPYTQDLIKHVSELKEGKESMKDEVLLALHNKGEEEARERCTQVIHPVKIWHGRSDQLVPYAAVKWMERTLPNCTSTIIPGATHALIYDKGNMEEVFTALQKGVQEARSTVGFAARRLGSQLSYVASNVFTTRDNPSSAATASTAAAPAGTTAGILSPRPGKKVEKATSEATAVEAQHGGKKDEPLDLRKLMAKAISKGTPNSSTNSLVSPTNSRHNAGTNGAGSGHGSGSGSGHGSGHVLGSGSGHGSSGHSLSWHSSGGGGGGSGHGTTGRRVSTLSANSGSRHGPGGSRHGSESAPPPIPENGELVGWTPALDRSSGPAGFLGEIGKQFSLALNGTFGSEGGSAGGDGDGETSGPASKPRLDSAQEDLEDAGASSHSAADTMSGVGRMAEGLMKRLDRVVSSMSIGDGSGHGSGWSGNVSAAGGSAHGSVASVGAWGGGNTGGGGGNDGAGGGSRRPSGILLPWSQQDVNPGRGDEGGGSNESDGTIEGSRRGGVACSTPREMPRGAKAFDAPASEPHLRVSKSMAIFGTPVRARPFAATHATPLRGFATEVTGSTAGGSWHGSAGTAGGNSGAIEAAVAMDKVAGYEAAMANWPAGKVAGNPAWEEWSWGKRLACHFITAGCLAVILLTW